MLTCIRARAGGTEGQGRLKQVAQSFASQKLCGSCDGKDRRVRKSRTLRYALAVGLWVSPTTSPGRIKPPIRRGYRLGESLTLKAKVCGFRLCQTVYVGVLDKLVVDSVPRESDSADSCASLQCDPEQFDEVVIRAHGRYVAEADIFLLQSTKSFLYFSVGVERAFPVDKRGGNYQAPLIRVGVIEPQGSDDSKLRIIQGLR